jgi:hypothetical protein
VGDPCVDIRVVSTATLRKQLSCVWPVLALGLYLCFELGFVGRWPCCEYRLGVCRLLAVLCIQSWGLFAIVGVCPLSCLTVCGSVVLGWCCEFRGLVLCAWGLCNGLHGPVWLLLCSWTVCVFDSRDVMVVQRALSWGC